MKNLELTISHLKSSLTVVKNLANMIDKDNKKYLPLLKISIEDTIKILEEFKKN